MLNPFKKDQQEDMLATESFIKKWLTNKNGTLATYIKDGDFEDIDLVKGREALSESLGLWMEYTLQSGNREEFENSFALLTNYFLEADGFVNWRLQENGQSEVFANALVDDLRICLVLFQASKKWESRKYKNEALRIGYYLSKHNVYQNILTDYYVKNENQTSQTITLSYIEPESLMELLKVQIIPQSVYESTLQILKDAPMKSSFFPKAYNVTEKNYIYDDNVNIVDQSIVVYYRAKMGYPTKAFKEFIQLEFKKHGKIYGQYGLRTSQSVVKYESPAVYGWLILYALEAGDQEFAQSLYSRMIQFKATHSTFAGGYSVYNEDTHIFDNLVPLLAESQLKIAKENSENK